MFFPDSLQRTISAAVAQAAVDELRRHGDQWKLDEEMAERPEVHSTPGKYNQG